MTAAQGTPNSGKAGKSINFIKNRLILNFSQKLSWGPLDRLKILSWSPLRFSTIENSVLGLSFFRQFWTQIDPWPISALVPLAKAILRAGPGQRPGWSPESWTPLTPNAKVPLICQFYCVLLRVGVTKYCKNQRNLLTRSVSAASATSWALLKQHRENPSVQALFGQWN